MRLEGTIHCDGPDCEVHQHVGAATMDAGWLPGVGWIKTTEYATLRTEHAFCTWDCLMKFAAQIPPPETFPGPEGMLGGENG